MTDDSKEFLLAEYTRIGGELISNEAMGDARANNFVTMWAAALAGVVAILGTNVLQVAWVPAALGIVGLIVVGAGTFVRLARRAAQTDRLIDALVRIRTILATDVLFVLPWGDLDREDVDDVIEQGGRSIRLKGKRAWLLHGGVLQMVAALNAGSAVLLLLVVPVAPTALIHAVTGAAVFAVEFAWLRHFFAKQFEKRRKSAFRFLKDIPSS